MTADIFIAVTVSVEVQCIEESWEFLLLFCKVTTSPRRDYASLCVWGRSIACTVGLMSLPSVVNLSLLLFAAEHA